MCEKKKVAGQMQESICPWRVDFTYTVPPQRDLKRNKEPVTDQ